MNELEDKNAELPNIETTLNSLRTRCGSNELEATVEHFISLQKKLQATLEKAQNLLEQYKRCLQLHSEYKSTTEAVRQWIISAHRQFDAAELLNHSHADLLRKQQLFKVETILILLYSFMTSIVSCSCITK